MGSLDSERHGMKVWMRRVAPAVALSAGLVAAMGGVAQADTNLSTSDNPGILSGNQLFVPIQIPINICGVAIGILGSATASCEGGATATMSF
jgi:hypothetical protein